MTAGAYDGRKRTDQDEHDLNARFARVFGTDDGEKVLAYLRRITIESVSGPGVDPNGLLHLEGQRYLTGIIQARINHGREGKPNVHSKKPK